MKDNKAKTDTQNKLDMKVLSIPVVGLLVLLGVVAFMLTSAYPRIVEQNDKRKLDEETLAVLEDKEAILRGSEVNVETLTDESVLALPEKTSALTMLSQLKVLASDNNLVFVKNTISSETAFTEDIHAVNASISVEADQIEDLSNFLAEIDNLAPLSRVERVGVKEERNKIAATVELSVFWSPFPKQLPALDAPISSLSANEQKLLTEISTLKAPEFVVVAPSNPEARENPFN